MADQCITRRSDDARCMRLEGYDRKKSAHPLLLPSASLSPRLAQPYIYPQAFVQPSLVLPTQVSTSVSSSPYLDYSAAYSQYAQAAFEQQYPYAASPAGFLSYSYATSPTATAGPAAAATAPATVHPNLPSATGPPPAFLHYTSQQHIQPDRMQ